MTHRRSLLAGISRGAMAHAQAAERFRQSLAQPLFLPTGLYALGPIGDRLRSMFPNYNPPVPYVLQRLVRLHAGDPQWWRA